MEYPWLPESVVIKVALVLVLVVVLVPVLVDVGLVVVDVVPVLVDVVVVPPAPVGEFKPPFKVLLNKNSAIKVVKLQASTITILPPLAGSMPLVATTNSVSFATQ